MIYLIFGKQALMIKSRLGKIAKERLPSSDEFNFVKFDGRETLVQTVVSECQRLPLGYERKMVVLEDAYFIGGTKTREKIEKDQDYQVLIDYLNHDAESTDLVFTLIGDTYNVKSDIGKIIKEKGLINEMTDITAAAWPEYVRRYFAKAGVGIDGSAVDELVRRCQGDATQFVSEAQKLMLSGGHVTIEDVVALVSRPLEENSFALSNALVKGSIEEALSIFRDLRTYSTEPVMLIGLLARQFRLMLKVKLLTDEGLNVPDIAKRLGIHEYRVRLAVGSQRRLGVASLTRILEQLYQLDVNIKSGLVDRFLGFELFLLNFNN